MSGGRLSVFVLSNVHVILHLGGSVQPCLHYSDYRMTQIVSALQSNQEIALKSTNEATFFVKFECERISRTHRVGV